MISQSPFQQVLRLPKRHMAAVRAELLRLDKPGEAAGSPPAGLNAGGEAP